MTEHKPIWEVLTTPNDLHQLESTLEKYQDKLASSARNIEADSIIAGLLLGPEIADELRLASTQMKRAAERALAAQVEVKVRIRELEKTARP